MKKIFLISFQILSILLLGFLVVSTFMPMRPEPGFLYLNNFYDSPLNLVLWLLLALILVAAVVFKGIRSPKQKIMHIALAAIIVLFIVDKSTNERFFVTIREGESIELSDHIQDHDNTLRLDRFEIDLHDDEETPRSYRSYLRLDDDDVILEVNKPLAIGNYRLYQSAYDRHYYFLLKIGDEAYEMTFSDSLETSSGQVVLDHFDERLRFFRILVNGDPRWLPLNADMTFDTLTWSIKPLEERYSSVIEVVKVTGLFWLLLAGIMYLIVMAWDFWKPRHKNKEDA